MGTSGAESEPVYKVLVNDEGQYSIYPLHQENPAGWREPEPGCHGAMAECLAFVELVWTDIRPLSQRRSRTRKTRS